MQDVETQMRRRLPTVRQGAVAALQPGRGVQVHGHTGGDGGQTAPQRQLKMEIEGGDCDGRALSRDGHPAQDDQGAQAQAPAAARQVAPAGEPAGIVRNELRRRRVLGRAHASSIDRSCAVVRVFEGSHDAAPIHPAVRRRLYRRRGRRGGLRHRRGQRSRRRRPGLGPGQLHGPARCRRPLPAGQPGRSGRRPDRAERQMVAGLLRLHLLPGLLPDHPGHARGDQAGAGRPGRRGPDRLHLH